MYAAGAGEQQQQQVQEDPCASYLSYFYQCLQTNPNEIGQCQTQFSEFGMCQNNLRSQAQQQF